MILYHNTVETVKTNDILFYRPEAIRKLGIMMMVNAAEANMDMVMDCPEEYKTKEDIEKVLNSLNEQALDMLEDHINDLRSSLESFLRNAKFRARVTRVDYSKANGEMSDVHVELDVE